MKKPLSYEEYQKQFSGGKREKALERAWLNRDFEIQLYWKRATYFWAFIASTFAAYFFIINNKGFEQRDFLELMISVIGIISSIVWFQVNRGSKKWQENWEKHIDLLEEEVTGPIYKTVIEKKGPSVSNMNRIISGVSIAIWSYLTLSFFIDFKKSYLIEINIGTFLILLILFFSLYYVLDVGKLIKKKDKSFSFSIRKQVYK